jgi:hypothetical protein
MKFLKITPILALSLSLHVNAKGASAAERRSSSVSADPEYARSFLNSFNSFCPTTGTWTANSLAAAKEIEKVLVNLRDDPNCQDVANSIAIHTQNLYGALDRIQRTSLERDIFSVQRQQSDLLKLLDTETDPARITEMEDLYRSNQFYLSLEEGKLEYDQNRADEYYQTNVMVNSAYQLFQQAALNQMCLIKSPTLLSSLSSIGTSFAAAMVTGGASLGYAAASNVLGYVFEYIRKSDLNKDIQKLGQATYVSAYQCVLESISNQWCQAQEASDLIDLKMSYAKTEPDTFSKGVRILNRELPVLIDWLNSVRAATDPQNSSISNRQIDFLNRDNALRGWRLKSIGLIGEEKVKLPASLNSDQDKARQFTILKNAIASMSPRSEGPKNPILDIATAREIPWIIAGIPIDDVPSATDSGGNVVVTSLNSFTPKLFLAEPKLANYYPLDPAEIEKGINDLFQQAEDTLSQQRNNVLLADPEILFWDAETPRNVGNIRGIQPIESINNILIYFNRHFSKEFQYLYSQSQAQLQDHIDDPYNNDPLCPALDPANAENNKERIYVQTRNVLCDIKNQINYFKKDPNERLNAIFEVANLENGTTAIENRVKKTMRVILTRVLEKASGDKLPIHAKLLVVNDIIDELTQYGKSNLTTQKFDIQESLQANEMTLQSFAEIFSDGISKTLKAVAIRSKVQPNRSQLLAKYCSLLLAIPDWSKPELKKIDTSVCDGVSLKSEWYPDQTTDPLSRSSFEREYHSSRRGCQLREFLRKEQFHQNYNKRSNSGSLLLKRTHHFQ